ncbi:helix-turn-helix transcriptional regulator [Pseudomonas sp. MMS21 TM103]|uniref:helix-turn-helix transcriptional regulator n=1 Tax=Pseudomonas sp. MMS21 TM103 TaxID=2886506 RepID=UPI002ED2A8CB
MGTNPPTKRSNTMTPINQSPLVMLRLTQVVQRTGLSRSTIYSKLDQNSTHYDSTFPKQVRLGRGSAVRFIEAEVNAWLEQCVYSSRAVSTTVPQSLMVQSALVAGRCGQ